MHFVKSVLIIIPGIFALSMMNHFMFMLITPFLQPSVDAVIVGINKRGFIPASVGKGVLSAHVVAQKRDMGQHEEEDIPDREQ